MADKRNENNSISASDLLKQLQRDLDSSTAQAQALAEEKERAEKAALAARKLPQSILEELDEEKPEPEEQKSVDVSDDELENLIRKYLRQNDTSQDDTAVSGVSLPSQTIAPKVEQPKTTVLPEEAVSQTTAPMKTVLQTEVSKASTAAESIDDEDADMKIVSPVELVQTQQPQPKDEIDLALDEILKDDGFAAPKESVFSEIKPHETMEKPKDSASEGEQPKVEPIKAKTLFEGDEVHGALATNIPIYADFDEPEATNEVGLGADFDVLLAKGPEEVVKPAEPVATAIPAIDLKMPASPLEELKRIQKDDETQPEESSQAPEEDRTRFPEDDEDAQMRAFLGMYQEENDSNDGEISKVYASAENGEVDIDAVPENWADLEADEEDLGQILPDVNGDGKFDQTDLDLMAAFGMEDELKEAISSEEVDKLKSELQKRNQQHLAEMEVGRTRGESLLGARAEYVSTAQNKEIFAKYKVKYKRLLGKLALGILCIILLFLIENASVLHMNLPKFMDPGSYQIVYALIDFQFVLFSVALVWDSMWFSFRSLWRKKPMPESITGVMFLMSILYTVLICILSPLQSLKMFNLPVAMCALLHQFYSYMRLRREIMSFKVVSSKKHKFAIDALPAKDASLEMEAFQDYIPDDPLMFKIKRASFIEGFYERMDTYPRSFHILGVIFPVAFLLAIAFFAAEFVITKNVYLSLNAGFITLFCTLPVTSYISLANPLYVASRKAYKEECAIIGESSLTEYANASIISFDDRDVFPADRVNVKNVKVYGNNRIDHVLYNTASVMKILGGPLGDIFTMAAREVGTSDRVSIRLIDDTGIEATVDDQTVVIGKCDFLARYGYKIEESDWEKQAEFSHEMAVMYLSYGDELAAKMYIEYNQDDGFEKILKQLYRQGMCVAIKTYDPNIDDALLASKVNIAKYPVKIIKCHREETQAEGGDRISTGVVSKSSAKNLLHTLSMCDKISGVLKTNTFIKLIATLIAMVGMAAMVLLGGNLEMPSIFVVLYQLIWMIPMLIIAKIKIN